MEKTIIIRYGEIHLKGKNKNYFEQLFKNGISYNLKDIKHTLIKTPSRYFIENFDKQDLDLIMERLEFVCGLHSYSVATKVNSDMDSLKKASLLYAHSHGTFKIETNRADKTFKLNSLEINRELGGYILENFPNLKVDVKKPDFKINIDMRETGVSYVFSDSHKGIGGMPTGSAGKGMLLVSGGLDSPVAGFMMAKRGMKIDAVHYHSYPYTNEQSKEKVVNLSKIISKYSCGLNLHIVKFTEIQEEIHKNCPPDLMITIMRRFMMRIAEKIALKTNNQCLITGESLGQVASQTVEGMTSTDSVIEKLPIFRPLIAFDKVDIIDIAIKIDTYNTSILPFEDCCTVFVPKHPAIKPKLYRIIDAEKNLDIDFLVNNAILNTETLNL